MSAARTAFLPLLALYLAADTATQLAFKAAATAIGDLPLGPAFLLAAAGSASAWFAAAAYLATYALWILILQRSDLAQAFPLTALSYVTVPMGAWLIFGERIGLVPMLGIALIFCGVWLIGQEESEHQPAPAAEGAKLS